MSLVPIETAMAFLGAPTADTTKVQLMLDAVSGKIEQFLGFAVLTATYSRSFSGVGSRTLFVPDRPLKSVSALMVDGQAVPQGSVTTFGFRNDDRAIYLTGPWRFERGILNIAATYSAGFDIAPPDIQQACLDWLKEVYAMSDEGRDPTVTAQRAGDHEVRYQAGGAIFQSQNTTTPMPAIVLAALRPRQRVIPT